MKFSYDNIGKYEDKIKFKIKLAVHITDVEMTSTSYGRHNR